MYYFLKVLNLISILFAYCFISNAKIDYWKPTIVSKALLSNASLTSDVFVTASDVICSMIASKTSWANLFCFNGQSCLLSNYSAVPYESLPLPPDPKNCMTKLDSCIFNGVLYNVGDIANATFPICSQICSQNGQWVMNDPQSSTPAGTCNPPFTQKSPYGCFHSNNSQFVNVCAARTYCKSLGADLWTFENNQSLAFTNIAGRAVGAYANDYAIGIYGKGSEFYWTNGALVDKTTDMWVEPYTATSQGPFDGLCARTSVDGWTVSFVDIKSWPCSLAIKALCRK